MQKLSILAPDKGINKYLPSFLVDNREWADGNNVHFGVGYVEKVGGWKLFLNFPDAWAAPRSGTVTLSISSPCVVTWVNHGLKEGNAAAFTTTGALPTGLTAGTVYYVKEVTAADTFTVAATADGAAINTSGAQSGTHTATKGYAPGEYVLPATANNHVYKCTTAGVAGASQPTWPATGTVTDGAIVWTEVGVNKLTGVLMAMDNYYQFDGDDYVMAITTTNCYVYDPANNTFLDITGATALTGTVEHPVVTENAQNCFVFTNGIDPVKYWTGSGNIADLPGLTDCEPDGSTPVTSMTCKTLLYFKNFLILGNTKENGYDKPQRVRWSCLGDITKWKNVDGDINQQQAGWADIADDVSWVQALRPLGNYVVVYKERAIQLLNYVGGDNVWDRWSSYIGTGIVATKAIVDLGDEHIFVANDNIYSFDGREPAIAGDAVAKEFIRLLDPDKYQLVTGFFVEEIPELWFAFPSLDSENGYSDKAIVYNTDTKAWSWRNMPMMAFGYYNRKDEIKIDDMEFPIDSWNTEIDSSVNLANAPINLCGDSAGNIYVFDDYSFNGADSVSFLTSKLLDFDAPDYIKRLLRIQFMISREGPYNLPVYIGTAENVDEDVTWYGPYNMSLDRTYPPWIDVDISGRYMCIKLGTVNADEPFKLTGYILYYELRGEV